MATKVTAGELFTLGLMVALGGGLVWMMTASAPDPATDTIGGPSIWPQDGTFGVDLAAIPGDRINTDMQPQITFLNDIGATGQGTNADATYIPLFGFIPDTSIPVG